MTCVGLEKPAAAGTCTAARPRPQSRQRKLLPPQKPPIAVDEAWDRVAAHCAVRELSWDLRPSLAPLLNRLGIPIIAACCSAHIAPQTKTWKPFNRITHYKLHSTQSPGRLSSNRQWIMRSVQLWLRLLVLGCVVASGPTKKTRRALSASCSAPNGSQAHLEPCPIRRQHCRQARLPGTRNRPPLHSYPTANGSGTAGTPISTDLTPLCVTIHHPENSVFALNSTSSTLPTLNRCVIFTQCHCAMQLPVALRPAELLTSLLVLQPAMIPSPAVGDTHD